MASSEKVGSPKVVVLPNMSPEARGGGYNKMLVTSGPVFVFQDLTGQPIEFFSPGKPNQRPVREYNEQETNAVFYGSNHFHLVDTTVRRETLILQAFLGSITSTNARLLSHLSLSFPALEAVQGQSGESGLQQDGMHSLKLLQDNCANLRTLKLYVHHGNAFGLVEETPSDSQSLAKTLSHVDTQLKAISSLERIIIRYYHDRPIPEVRQLMQGLGWIVLMGDKELS